MRRKYYKTKRLEIRPLKRSDYKEWKNFYCGLDTEKNEWDLKPRTEKDCSREVFHKILERHKKRASDDDCYIYAAFSRTNGKLIGVMDIKIIARDWYDMANLGYRVGNHYWGKGYGTEMVKKIFEIAKVDLKIHRLEAAINLHNKASINLAKKAGMKKEGIKKGYIHENNRWVDHVIYVQLSNPTFKS